MMKLLVCALASIFLFPGCGLLKKFKKKPALIERNQGVRLAGRIYKVDEAARFVMIRRYGPWRVGEGDVVITRGAEGRSANLLPTGERLGEHVAADIRSGTVQVGDGVYIRSFGTSQKPKSSTNPEKPAELDDQPKTAGSP